ncbi:MAG TPA: DMT family transporter [Azospirillaceae bacterium]|nr:DMT family transporter [Azospirillaceae bacterium]
MTRLHANLLLLAAAVIWGSSFVVQHMSMEHIGPLAFTGSRFLLGTLVVLPLAVFNGCSLRREGRRLSALDWVGMVLTGVALFCGAILQQIGIGLTTVTNAGFLTGLYVPLVPLIALLVLRTMPHPVVWPAGLGCLAGTYLLSGAATMSLAAGDVWVMVSTVFWAIHVLLVGAMAVRTGAPIVVAVVQFMVAGLLATSGAVFTEATSLADVFAAWPAIAYTGVLSVGLAFTFQVVGQRFTTAADAAIILSSETVFAAIGGAVFLGESLSAAGMVGCALILVCILTVQMVPVRRSVVEPAV